MIEEGWIDLLITAAVMGGETQGQRLIAGLSDKRAELRESERGREEGKRNEEGKGDVEIGRERRVEDGEDKIRRRRKQRRGAEGGCR